MLMQELILRKREGSPLSTEEIDYFISAYTAGDIPDYQAAALLMTIWFNQMDERETADLTMAIRDSGDIVDLSSIEGVKIDKHSTGGVSDSTSLVAAPLVAACGGRVAKISGRGLGHTGGTIDKLESIPGLVAERSRADLIDIVTACGLAIIGQSANLVPADRKLYALRDVTGTVDNLALITSSIMSKKLAAGGDAIVLDVKNGNGAFMRNIEQARELAQMMTAVGRAAGKRTSALVTDMNQPLGRSVGNSLEVQEAIEVLRGEKCEDLKKVSLALAAEMLVCGKLAENMEGAVHKLEAAIASGAGLERLEQMIELMDGDPAVCSDTTLLPQAAETVELRARSAGFVSEIATDSIGRAALLLGAGRAAKEDKIDPAVGLKLTVRLGDEIRVGDEIGRLFVNDRGNLDRAIETVYRSIAITDQRRVPPALIYDRMTSE